MRYEISFYLFVFLVLFVVSAVPHDRRRRTFELAVLFASALLLSARFTMPISGTPLFMVQVFSFLAIGALFWLQRRSETLSRMPDVFAYSALTALLVVNLFQYTNSIHATVATACAALTGAMLTEMSIEDKKLAKFDHACGDLSYTIFLLHIPVAQLVKNYMGTSIASFSTAMILSFVVAIPISIGVRRATRPLRDRIRGRKLV